MFFRRTFFRFAVAMSLLPFGAQGFERTLTGVSEVRRMGTAEAGRGAPLRIRGIVTALSGWKNSFFLQDSAHGISVDRTDSADVRPGDLVEVTGKTGAGRFAPVVQADKVQVLARERQMPRARASTYADLAGGKLDSQRIEIYGVLHSTSVRSIWGRQVLLLDVDLNGQRVTARVHDFPKRDFSRLIDATVRIRGVAGTVFNERRQFIGVRLFVRSLDDVSIEQPGSVDPFSIPETPLAKLLQFDPTEKTSHRVRVSGVLIGARSGQALYLQEGDQGIVVHTEKAASLPLASRITAVGFLGGSESSPNLTDAVVRAIGPAVPPAPIGITAASVVSVRDGFHYAPSNGLLVEVEGDLINRIDHLNEQVWVLRDGGKVFQAYLQAPTGAGGSSDIAEGSRVRVRGVCIVDIDQTGEAQSFRVLLRNSRDIRVVSSPLISASRLIWIALAILALSVLVLVMAFRMKRVPPEEYAETSDLCERRRRLSHRAARIAGLLSIGLSGIVYVGGWIFDIAALRTILSGYSSMRPTTAVGLFLAGLALYLDRENQSLFKKAICQICAALTIAIGVASLFGFWLGEVATLDSVLVKKDILLRVPGHMAFVTAANFVLIGLGISFSRTKKSFGFAQCCTILAGSVSLFNAIGFFYGVRSFYGLAAGIPPTFGTAMSIHTSIAMALLSAGILLSRPSWGVMITLTSNGPGGLVARRLIPCGLIFPALIAWLRVQGQTRGFYDETFGITLVAVTNIVIFKILIWRSASLLNRSDIERSQAEGDLRESERSFRQLADAMPAIVWTADPDGNVDYYNQRWHEYSGLTPDWSRGSGWTIAIHPDDLQTTLSKWSESVQTGALYEGECRFRNYRDASYRWHLVRAVPVLDRNGRISRWFGTSTDIEDYKTAQESVRRLNETLEERVHLRTAALAEANKELAETRTRLQGVLDAATQIAIIAADSNGTIRIFNRGAERMLQYSAAEVQGIYSPLVFHDVRECEQRTQELSRALGISIRSEDLLVAHAQRGMSDAREWTYIRKDGSRLEVAVAVTPVQDVNGEFQGYLAIATDITARKQLERELRLYNDQLAEQTRRAEKANRIKSDFLATMSHEIRTPMNAILGMADLLWESELNADQMRYVEVFRRAGANLLTLINGILDLSKIEAGHLEVEQIEFDLEEVVRTAVELATVKAREKRLPVLLRIAPQLKTALIGDPLRLRQILINLLGNAVKFTDQGEVLLTVRNADPKQPELLEFSVSDTGIGIPAERLESIFEDFTQVDSSITRRFGGTGLGLGISKRLIEKMGGKIEVDSILGQGSTFRFQLPFELAKNSAPAEAQDLADLHGRRVLILDDNATNRLILRETLNCWGLVSVEFDNGRDALAHLASSKETFSLVIVDHHMPDMDGFLAANYILRDTPAMPVVMLTSDHLPGHANRSKETGLAGYAVKPVKRSDLLRLICDALNKRRTITTTTHRLQATGKPASTSLNILVAEDSSDNRLLVQAYLKGTGHHLTFADNGLEAIEVFEENQFDLILMDMQMPLMDGVTATREIRQWEIANRRDPIPILALSANARPEDIQQCQAAGCTDHLSKPISKARLINAIESHAFGVKEKDMDTVWVDMPEGLETLVPGYLESRRKELPRLFSLLSASEFDHLKVAGHKMKGGGSSYGFKEISIIGASLERHAESGDREAVAASLESLANYLRRVEIRAPAGSTP